MKSLSITVGSRRENRKLKKSQIGHGEFCKKKSDAFPGENWNGLDRMDL